MADYPNSVPTFATVVDGVDDVLAAHQNVPNLEITAIATELGTLPKGAAADVKTRLNDISSGWTKVSDTWTYASASTITIPSDGTATYQKCMKIRFKQGAGFKYYYAHTVAATLLTVAVNTDYTVANAAITDIAYSFADDPYGFPHHFAFTAGSITGFSVNPTVTFSYSVTGRKLFFRLQTTDGTGNSDAFSFTSPFPARVLHTGSSSLVRNNSTNEGPGYWQIAAGTSVLAFYRAALAAWTAAAGKAVYASGFYEIQP